MTKEEIRTTALTALDWAKGSWGQGQYDKAKYDDDTMAEIWKQIAEIAKERADKYEGK